MTEKQFLKSMEKAPYIFLGRFENEFGEPYRIYEIYGEYRIAGSENDWQLMHVSKNCTYAFEEFRFSDEETKQIKNLIKI